MKKTISINISGILFHIEEDGYDTLRKYLDAINKHFSSYPDNQEIISDIENRIAEIFLSNLKNNKQVITAENVDNLIKKMGTIADFVSVEENETEKEQNEEKASSDDFYKYVTPPDADKKGYKKLMRSEPKKILGGVCAGIANYFRIDPLWVRLIALLLLFSGNINGSWSGPGLFLFDDFRLKFSFGLFAVVAYIVLWIILPVSYDYEEDKNIKKLYRNPDDKALGGVASGLAAYFGVEVLWIRLAFVFLTIAGGSGVLIYLILWIITPVAMSITERIKMKGGEITLDNIDSTLKENMNPVPPQPESTLKKIVMTPFRILGQVIEAIGKALGPLGKFIFAIFRIVFGLIVLFIGLAITITPILTLAFFFEYLNPNEYIIETNQVPFELFTGIIPDWLAISSSFLLIIPGIIFMLLGLSVLIKKNLVGNRFGLVAFVIWLLFLGITLFQIPRIASQFKEENWHRISETIPVTEGTMLLTLDTQAEDPDFNEVSMKIEGTADSLVTLEKEFFSRGKSKAESLENAKMLGYQVSVLDSIVTFPPGFDYSAMDVFRDQKVNLVLKVPYEKPFLMDRSLLDILRNTLYRNGYKSSDVREKNIWAFNEAGLVCLTCGITSDETENQNQSDEESEEEQLNREKLDSLSRVKYLQRLDSVE
ncbi:PspC domain-containing protein [Algoriphagus kandeliae]|uniref:PspC domain-containing protein n=1 Tax=Algoriphagus kandeliae TaxID=2562278 RepID=A0A4Y9QQI0_9BACT|nr:PspC domain-containing protein [Algoriphagus kandeliae]TFV94447.1 PspC domain-containing protein [Algoriphagus kandeliae]